MSKNELKIIIQTALVVSSFWLNFILFTYEAGKNQALTFFSAIGAVIIAAYLIWFIVYIFMEEE